MNLTNTAGFATVEAAIALVSIVLVLTLCCGAMLAMSMQVRCVDAAREAARLEARGDTANARSAAARVAPPGARISVGTDSGTVTASVAAKSPLLPLLTIAATAVAATEPAEPR